MIKQLSIDLVVNVIQPTLLHFIATTFLNKKRTLINQSPLLSLLPLLSEVYWLLGHLGALHDFHEGKPKPVNSVSSTLNTNNNLSFGLVKYLHLLVIQLQQ